MTFSPFRPTTGADLNWARDTAIAAAEILRANIHDSICDNNEIIGQEEAATLTDDDSGDYTSAACGIIQFLRPYLTAAYYQPTPQQWTLGAIRDNLADFLKWEATFDADSGDFQDIHSAIPNDIYYFFEELTTAGCGDWTNAFGDLIS